MQTFRSDTMRKFPDRYPVLTVGLTCPEFQRISNALRDEPIELLYGGHISDGSNACRDVTRACCDAIRRSPNAYLVLWNPKGARHFKTSNLNVRKVSGNSSAISAVREWLNRSRNAA